MDKKSKELPQRSITIKIEGNSYLVKFPNTGQFLDISTQKSFISSGQQNKYNRTTISGIYSYQLVEAIAFYNICVPDLRKDLNVESFFDLDIIQSKILVDVYTKDIAPWIDEWLKILNTFEEEEKDEK